VQNQQRSQPGTATSPAKSEPGTATTNKQRQTDSADKSSAADGTSGGSPSSAQPSKLERMAHLLKEGTPLNSEDGVSTAVGTADDDQGEDGGSRKSKPKRFNELAKIAGLETAELYGLEIATAADGSPVTVEMLKDHHAERSDFSVAQLRWEEDRARQQGELVRGNAELRELLAAIPRDKLDPKVLETIKTKVTENAKRERARTLEVIPDWKDDETMTKDLTGMGEWLKGYGFPPDYLKTVYDHRAMLMMRDAWRREVRVRAILEQVEKEPAASLGKGKPQGKSTGKQPSSGPKPRGRAGLEALLQE
jgi:hypothetical protein